MIAFTLDFEKHPFLANPWLVVVGGTVLVAIVMLVFRILVLGRMRKYTDRSRFSIDSIVVRAAGPPINLLILVALMLIATYLMIEVDLYSGKQLSDIKLAAQIITVVATVLFIDRFVRGLIVCYSETSVAVQNSKGVILGLTRGLVVGVGVLVLLGTMGVSVTPIIASLGISSLAVALALQPTLENFFSGVQLVLDKPIRVGDYIELSSGEQGFVERIGWRTTWIKMLQNNTVIIPNSELSKSRLINYFYPEKELSVPVDVGVHYSSDLEHVERVTLEVARETLLEHEWGVETYEPKFFYTAFDSSSINVTVILRAKEYFNRFWVRSAFIKKLHKRYAEEGIVIPFPITAINTDQESAIVKVREMESGE